MVKLLGIFDTPLLPNDLWMSPSKIGLVSRKTALRPKSKICTFHGAGHVQLGIMRCKIYSVRVLNSPYLPSPWAFIPQPSKPLPKLPSGIELYKFAQPMSWALIPQPSMPLLKPPSGIELSIFTQPMGIYPTTIEAITKAIIIFITEERRSSLLRLQICSNLWPPFSKRLLPIKTSRLEDSEKKTPIS